MTVAQHGILMFHHQQIVPDPATSNLISSRFIVGQDGEGRWVAVESHGLSGGIFASRDAAIRYASFETDHRPGAVQVSTELLSLRL